MILIWNSIKKIYNNIITDKLEEVTEGEFDYEEDLQLEEESLILYSLSPSRASKSKHLKFLWLQK